jgi:glycosyltransferase involved in cell wall biosynthesis
MKVLIVVENLPVPFDRRVWRECQALRDAGYKVSVISPNDSDGGLARREVLDGVAIYRYRPRHADQGLVAYAIEYLVAVVMSAWLMIIVLRREGFDVIQICNPPDLLFLAAFPFKIFGKRLIFDQHDVCPEIYMAQNRLQIGAGGLVVRILLLLERVTYLVSDAVLVVNESCRQVALSRGRKDPRAVYVVRNGPSTDSIRNVEPDPRLKAGKRYLLVYVGMMGSQDGIDVLVRTIRELASSRAERDFAVRIIGGGPLLEPMKVYARELGVDSYMDFTGPLPYAEVLQNIATADVCLCPDPKTPLSDMCSLAKSVEYMSLGKPFVAFDLTEVRRAAGDACLYAESGEEREFAEQVNRLLNDANLRRSMGQIGHERVLESMTWEHSIDALLEAYAFSLH